MNSRKTPRWANVTWCFGALLIVFAYVLAAHRRGYDFVVTVGFLWSNFADIFVLLVLLGLALYVLVALVHAIRAGNLSTPDARTRTIRDLKDQASKPSDDPKEPARWVP